MCFWWLMLGTDVIVPVVMIIAGRMMWKRCPRQINSLYGYRTERSMKNMETWKFAHEHSGRLWWRIGWVMLVCSIALLLPFVRSGEVIVTIVGLLVCTAQVIGLIVSVIPTEAALKKKFDEDGNPRE
ncbi:MAG: SdpI family protein [Clostridia bacterium]|nr:SdpI family protein [Clostridia bacterium]